MTTTTKTTTLADLAAAVNNLIETQPYKTNPIDGSLCVYHKADTDERCLIGQALYDLTGLNVPAEFENENIETLLRLDKFRRFFGLEFASTDFPVMEDIGEAQSTADGNYPWGSVSKIEI